MITDQLSGETHYCPRNSSLFECLDIHPACLLQSSVLLWTSDNRRPSAQLPSPSPACHHGSYCCTVAQLRWLVSALRTMEIVQLLKCIMCIAWIFSTSPQKPPTTYTRVNDFRPHRHSLFRGATYTWERLIREYIRYVSLTVHAYCTLYDDWWAHLKVNLTINICFIVYICTHLVICNICDSDLLLIVDSDVADDNRASLFSVELEMERHTTSTRAARCLRTIRTIVHIVTWKRTWRRSLCCL